MEKIVNMLARADIKIDGSRPWDMQINDKRTLQRMSSDPVFGCWRKLYGRLVGLRQFG